MKKIVLVVLIAMALITLLSAAAYADMIEGAWTGEGQVLGRTMSVSVSFDGQGNFSAFGAGMNVAGAYTLYDGSVTLEANNMSMSLVYSTDGAVETLTGSMTYIDVSGNITLERSVASAPVIQAETEADASVPIEDIYAVWKNSDRMAYSLKFYKSGFCVVSLGDTQEADESLAASVSEMELPEAQVSMPDFISAVKNSTAKVYSFPARFSVNRSLITIKLLHGDFSQTPQSFFTPSWDKDENVITLGSAGENGVMTVYNMSGKSLALTAFPIDGDMPQDEFFWRYTTLVKGERGDSVKLLQEKLIEKGFLSGKADGIFGAKTQAAIESLQEKNGLEVSGAANEDVWDVLLQ